MKPVGQESVETAKGSKVDKDVLVFKQHFSLKDSAEQMSPVLVPSGFTRDFLDGQIKEGSLASKIEKSFHKLTQKNDFLVVEGTGHCGVGSIINLNNAQVASLLNLPVLLLASGGLGSAFDEATLSKILCDKYGVRVIGVLLTGSFLKKKRWSQPTCKRR